MYYNFQPSIKLKADQTSQTHNEIDDEIHISDICFVTSSCICKTVLDWSLLSAGKLHHFLFKVTTCSDLEIGQLAVWVQIVK